MQSAHCNAEIYVKYKIFSRMQQLKTKFQMKLNFRPEWHSARCNWIDILSNTDQLPEDIQEKLEEIDWVNYVVDEADFIKNLTKF